MNLYKTIKEAISPKSFQKDKGVGKSRARQKVVSGSDVVNNWTYWKVKQILEQYEHKMKQN